MENNINIIGTKCVFCRNCENKCPKSAISFKENFQGFEYPKIDSKKCINCGICLKVCPVHEINFRCNENDNKYYYGNSKDISVLKESSSGGIFTELISLLKEKYNNLFIIGATLKKNKNKFYLEHICQKCNEDLKPLKKSKYIQSNVGDCFEKAKKLLDKDEIVVFCGTPCQAAALNKYLNKSYNNLFLLDFICHGVPSEKLLNSYLKYKYGKKQLSNISSSDIDFRYKEPDRENYSFRIKDDISPSKENLFFSAFLSDIALRSSCYSCKFKGDNRFSDITIGDFWTEKKNLINKLPNGNYGVSCIVVHTKKGREIISELLANKKANLFESDSTILEGNKSYYASPKYHNFFKIFYLGLNGFTFSFKICIFKIIRKLSSLLRKV